MRGAETRQGGMRALGKAGGKLPRLSLPELEQFDMTEPNESAPAIPYTVPTRDGKAHIFLPVFPVTEAQKSWLRGNGFRALAITFADLQELLLRVKD